MKKFSGPVKSIIASAAAVGILALGGALPAFAAADTGVVLTAGTLSGGALTFNNTGAFTAVTLNGTQQTAIETLSIANVVDGRGSGAGWNVSLTLIQFKQWSAGTYSGTYTLPTSSTKITVSPVVSLADASSSAANTVTPVTTTTALDTAVAVKLLSAAASGGMGSYAVANATMTMTVPANAFAATYKTDATVSLNATP